MLRGVQGRVFGALLLCLGLSLLLAGCAPLVQAPQPAVEQWLPVQAGASLGQTFVANYDGLQAVLVLLEPETPGEGTLTLSLYPDLYSATKLGSASLSLQDVTESGPYRFDFPALVGSNQQYIYALIEVEGSGSVRVAAGPADAYLDGAAYQDDQPIEAQLAFSLSYAPGRVGLGLAREALTWAAALGAGLLLFVVPGWGLLAVFWSGWSRLSWAEKASLGAALGLALTPLLMLFTDLLGLHLGVLHAWLPALLGLALIAWTKRGRLLRRSKPLPTEKADASRRAASIVLVMLFFLIAFTRFWTVRGLEAPLWGDALHHTTITQLLLDHGGLFNSWQPYTPYESLTVQYGFSAVSAVLAWITGWSSVQASLWMGQMVNILAVFSAYPLALRLSRGSHWAGVGAVLLAGLVSPMAAYYVNWGRYAQIAGLAILPGGLWLLIGAAEGEASRKVSLAKIALAAVVLAGMALTYYRLMFFYAVFAAAWLVCWGLPTCRANLRLWLGLLARLALTAAIAGLLFLPWWLRMQGSALAGLVESAVAQGTPLERVLADYQPWLYFFNYVSRPLAALALIGLVWSLLRRDWSVAAVALWTLGLASLKALALLRIPGADMVQNFAVLISLYLPAALLGGYALGRAAEALERLNPRLGGAAAALLIVAAGAWFAWQGRAMAAPHTYALVTRPDLRAMVWIEQSVPEEAVFLVEGFSVQGYTAVGADAGWWIPLLAGRANTMPPQYALMNEVPAEPEYTRQVVQLVKDLEATSLTETEGIQALCEMGVTHIYIGQRQGLVGEGARQLYALDELLNSPVLTLLYRQDRVAVFALDAQACENGR